MTATLIPANEQDLGVGLTLHDMVPTLQGASTGSRRLDLMIGFALGQVEVASGAILRMLLDSDLRPDHLTALVDGDCPPYTTSLDAALPDENIILALYQPQRQCWTAVHREGEADVVATGANEVLARRAAALKAALPLQPPRPVAQPEPATPPPALRDPPQPTRPAGTPAPADMTPGRGRSEPPSPADDWEILW